MAAVADEKVFEQNKMYPMNKNDDVEGNIKDDTTRLLKLIDEGDASAILSEKNFGTRFNELVKYELVAIKKDRIRLTEMGRHALRIGAQSVIDKIKRNVERSVILKQGMA